MSEPSRDRARGRRRLAQTVMTLCAWLVAFVVVLALLTVLGEELESLPLALRALVISGVLVFLMVNLVMPVLSVAVRRWLTGPMIGNRANAGEIALGEPKRMASRVSK
jgi:antibiotic biosynthesis monooxygenase (ABM) superfamily enzyme